MEELLNIYDLQANLIGVQERSAFYAQTAREFKETGTITRQPESIRILLMNSAGRIYVQKRSNLKEQNAGLYDKTIGGHIQHNHSVSVTIVKECAEELGIPAVLLSKEEFNHAIHSTDLSIVGVFKKVGFQSNYLSLRKHPQGDYMQPFISTFIMGYYDGAIRFVDGESSGVEVFALSELQRDMEMNPAKYTEDLKYFIQHYSTSIVPIDQIPVEPADLL